MKHKNFQRKREKQLDARKAKGEHRPYRNYRKEDEAPSMPEEKNTNGWPFPSWCNGSHEYIHIDEMTVYFSYN